MTTVRYDKITRVFNEGGGIRDFECTIAEGEFFAFLGPSGCGKTTTLRITAGLEQPDSGRLYFDDDDVTGTPPEKRDAAMVFQSYALFPHMTVFENVAFGLRARKAPKDEIADRVHHALSLVQLDDLASRPVPDMSGGQQQRVALARALAVRPRVLLMDEPLSNLDAELRYTTRKQLAELQDEIKLTAIYVTHDQEEALELADKIAVLKGGVCQQIGTPNDVLESPATPFVESFMARERARRGG